MSGSGNSHDAHEMQALDYFITGVCYVVVIGGALGAIGFLVWLGW